MLIRCDGDEWFVAKGVIGSNLFALRDIIGEKLWLQQPQSLLTTDRFCDAR